jgi:hypothetical protein
MFLLLELLAFIIIVVVAPGLPLIFVLPIARCDILGLL